VDSRDALAQAMVELAGTEGFDNVTLEALVERAGATPEDFDREFETIEACFAYAFGQVSADLNGAARAAFDTTDGEWRVRLRAACYAACGFLQSDRIRARFAIVEVLRVGEPVATMREHSMDAFIEMIDAGRLELPDSESLPRSLAVTVTRALADTFAVSVGRGDLDDLRDAVPELMCLAVMPYLGVGAALLELHEPPPG